jgi:hypothetical protein
VIRNVSIELTLRGFTFRESNLGLIQKSLLF